MYNELQETWKRELDNAELERLAPDFYTTAATYIKRLREEGRMLDKRTVKARLFRSEIRNAKRMLRELAQTRYAKVIRELAGGKKVSAESLTDEEQKIFTGCASMAEVCQIFVEGLLRGKISLTDVAVKHKTIALRFVRGVPEIIGADMKTYGPFKVEDIASLPVDNANILVKQGLAEKIEIN